MSDYTSAPPSRSQNFSAHEDDVRADALGKRKGTGAPLRRAFIEKRDESPTPLSLLLSGANASQGGGGRGGRLRVALMLTLIWRLARSPHTTIRPARYWAELLQLDDPERAGARAIRNTLLELERRGFIRSEDRGPGKVPEITLRDESLSGSDYKLPYLQAIEEGGTNATNYFRVPESFWATGLCSRLSGAGLAMYLIAMARAGWGDRPSFWISPKHFVEEYGLGESTRKKGLRELVDHGVVTQELRSIDRAGDSSHRKFVRSVYTVVADYRVPGSTEPELAPLPPSQSIEELLAFLKKYSP